MESTSGTKADIQLKTQTKKPKTRLETLRNLIKELENQVARISDLNEEEVIRIPKLFDEVDDNINELGTLGTDLSSELGQISTLSGQFNKVGKVFIRKVGGPNQMEAIRQERKPPSDHWWWYVDKSLLREGKLRTRRILILGGIIVILIFFSTIVYKQFFAPDPAFQAAYTHQQQAENAMVELDFQTALVEVQSALTFAPEDTDLYTMQGVILEAIGLQDEAINSFDTAKTLYNQPDDFYSQRSFFFLMINEPQQALVDAQTAIKINPKSAISYLQQGQVYMALSDREKAIQSYEKADEIAQETGDIQLQAMIRINLANFYQQISLPTMNLEEELKTDTP